MEPGDNSHLVLSISGFQKNPVLDAWVLPHLNIRDLTEFSMAVALSTSENYRLLMSCNYLKYFNLHSDQ